MCVFTGVDTAKLFFKVMEPIFTLSTGLGSLLSKSDHHFDFI